MISANFSQEEEKLARKSFCPFFLSLSSSVCVCVCYPHLPPIILYFLHCYFLYSLYYYYYFFIIILSSEFFKWSLLLAAFVIRTVFIFLGGHSNKRSLTAPLLASRFISPTRDVIKDTIQCI